MNLSILKEDLFIEILLLAKNAMNLLSLGNAEFQ